MVVTVQAQAQTSRMHVAKIASAIALLIWGLFAVLGWRLILSESAIGISGYPTAAQWRYFAYFPTLLSGLAIGLLALGLSPRTPDRLRGVAGAFSALLIVTLPIYIVWWVGGIRPH